VFVCSNLAFNGVFTLFLARQMFSFEAAHNSHTRVGEFWDVYRISPVRAFLNTVSVRSERLLPIREGIPVLESVHPSRPENPGH
jgi:hypothetical protein